MSRRTPRRLGTPQPGRLRKWSDHLKDAATVVAAIGTIGGGGLWIRDWLKDRTALDAITVNRTRLQSPDGTERLRALDTLTALIGSKPGLADLVFRDVANVIAQQTRRPIPLSACGRRRDSLQSNARYGPDVEAAFAFLRRFRRRNADSVIALQRVDLNRANLNGADLRLFDFKESCLDSAQLMRTQLDGAQFADVVMRDSRFDSARGSNVVFNRADLRGAVLDADTLPGAVFAIADLRGSSFQLARLEMAQFSSAKLSWANFSGAKLSGVTDWEEVDTNHVTGALFAAAEGLAPAHQSWLRRYGACIDPIEIGDWNRRFLDKALRDTTCGLPNAKGRSRRQQ